jgi:NAD+ kinase
LNEVVIDRGTSPYSTALDLYIDGNKFTSIIGDGLIISTPTGSTAYNLSCGGSIVQANTECILVTPLSPHSLSFRPLVLHSSAVITIKKPEDNRSSTWVSLDGATRFEFQDGESLVVSASLDSLKMVTLKSDNLTDLWAQRL